MSALLFSAMLCSSLLFCSVLCSSLLCGFSGREMPFSGREIPISWREKTIGMGISPVDSQQGCILLCSMEQLHRLQVAADWFSRPLMRCCIHPDRQWFCPHLYAELRKKLTTNGQLREIFFGLYNLSRRVCQGEFRQNRKRRCPEVRPRHTICKFICTG